MSPSSATRSRARCRSPRNTPPCASESTGPAAPRVRPWSWRRTLGRLLPRSRRTRLRAAPLAGGRRRRGPVSAASRTTSPSGRPDGPPADPSPQPDSDPLSPLNRVRPRPLRQRAVKDIILDMETLAISKANTKIEDTPVRTVIMGEVYLERKETEKSRRFLCLIGEKGKVLLTFFTAK